MRFILSTRSHHNAASTAIFLIIVATVANLVMVAAEEDATKTESHTHPDGPPVTPQTPTTTKPETFVASSPRSNSNGGFKPSSFEREQNMRHDISQMKFPESGEQTKVKREQEAPPAIVRLYDGPEPGQAYGEINDGRGQEGGEQLDQPGPKAPRGYYDESPHHRGFGGHNPYGHNLPSAPQDEENEIEPVPHAYPKRPQQNLNANSFRQDPIVNQYRQSPDKYQQYGPPPPQTPGNARRPTPSPVPYKQPYSYENPGSGPYYGYTPIVNDYSKPTIIASMPYHYPAGPLPAPVQPASMSMPAPSEGIHTVRHTQSEIGFEIGPGISKALKLLLPTAILLTGASALFPNRVYVPTQPKNIQRQKRGVDYTPIPFSDESIEYIPASLLRREHRTDDSEPELYDYDDGTPNPYFGEYAPAKQAKNAKPTAAAVKSAPTRQAPTTTQKPKPKAQKTPKSTVLRFLPIPTSPTGSEEIDPFDLPPQEEYDAFQFRSKKKEAPKQSKNQVSGVERIPRSRNLASNIKSSPVEGSPTSMTPIDTSTTVDAITAPVSNQAKRVSRKRVKPATGVQVTPTGATVLTLPSGTISTSAPTAPTTKITTTTMKSKVRHFPVMEEAVREIMASAATLEPFEEQIQQQVRLQQQHEERKIFSTAATSNKQELVKTVEKVGKQFDMAPDGPVMGLLTAAVEYRQDSDVCQRRALCDLAMRGTNPTATRFETFLWALANLTPNAFTAMYDIDDVFQTIRDKNCERYKCANPNHNIQIQ